MSSPIEMSSPYHSKKEIHNYDTNILSTPVEKIPGFESLTPELKFLCMLQEKRQAFHQKERKEAADERNEEKKQAALERDVERKRAAQERD